MLGSMKLRKFLRSVGGAVNPAELKQSGFDVKKMVKAGLIVLAGLGIVLAIVFVVLPSVWGFWQKNPQTKTADRQPLTYTLINETDSAWKGVVLELEGATVVA